MYVSMFRVGAPEGEFQISMDCTYRPNDVVPIVGKTLLNNCRCLSGLCWTLVKTKHDITNFNQIEIHKVIRFKVCTLYDQRSTFDDSNATCMG